MVNQREKFELRGKFYSLLLQSGYGGSGWKGGMEATEAALGIVFRLKMMLICWLIQHKDQTGHLKHLGLTVYGG